MMKESVMDGTTSGYSCPVCHWEPPDDSYVFDGNGITVVDGETSKKMRDAGRLIYPVFSEFHTISNMNGYYDEWLEVHCCPRHGEFKMENGT